jgi:hypothetical protein
MAKKVTASVIGGREKTYDEVESIQDLIEEFDLSNPSIKVNGQSVDEDYDLPDYAYVSFGTKVKGGRA